MGKLDHIPPNYSEYAGMTVNERLYVSGQLDDYEQACKRKDRERMTEILRRVEISEPEATIEGSLHPYRSFLRALWALIIRR